MLNVVGKLLPILQPLSLLRYKIYKRPEIFLDVRYLLNYPANSIIDIYFSISSVEVTFCHQMLLVNLRLIWFTDQDPVAALRVSTRP
jgi:hypothetical protein